MIILPLFPIILVYVLFAIALTVGAQMLVRILYPILIVVGIISIVVFIAMRFRSSLDQKSKRTAIAFSIAGSIIVLISSAMFLPGVLQSADPNNFWKMIDFVILCYIGAGLWLGSCYYGFMSALTIEESTYTSIENRTSEAVKMLLYSIGLAVIPCGMSIYVMC